MPLVTVSGDPVSLETQNGLLELLAYYGLGNPRMRSGVNSESGEDVEMGEEVTGRGGEGGMVEVDQLGEELGKHGSDEATAYLAEEVVKTVELEDARNSMCVNLACWYYTCSAVT